MISNNVQNMLELIYTQTWGDGRGEYPPSV